MTKRNYYLLGLIESIASLVWLISIPGEQENAWFLGYSLTHWSILAPILLISLGFIWKFGSYSRKNSQKKIFEGIISQRKKLVLIVIGIVFSLISDGAIGFVIWNKDVFSKSLSTLFIDRLVPLFFLTLVISVQTLLLLVKNKQAFTDKRADEIEREDIFYHPTIKEIIRSKPDVIAIILLGLSMAIFFWIPISNIINISGPSDFREHIRFAVESVENKSPVVPHFFYHLLVIITQFIPGVDYSLSSKIIVTVFFSISSILIYPSASSGLLWVFRISGHRWTFSTG